MLLCSWDKQTLSPSFDLGSANQCVQIDYSASRNCLLLLLLSMVQADWIVQRLLVLQVQVLLACPPSSGGDPSAQVVALSAL